MFLLLMVGSCAWIAGLTVLEELPSDFPLDIDAAPVDIGNVTRSNQTGQIAVDLSHDTPAAATARWNALRAQAEAAGFAVTDTRRNGKREEVSLAGPQGKVTLGCCLQRADGRHVVFVSWWRP